MAAPDELLRTSPIFGRLNAADRAAVAAVADVLHYAKGSTLFEQDSPSDSMYEIVSGRVKVFRMAPTGKDLILEIFGPGDPLGVVALYMNRPFPAAATALEDTTCLAIPRDAFFQLLEASPSVVRGLLLGLTTRLIQLTNRLTELTGGRIEPRFARLFLKLAAGMGCAAADGQGIVIPLALSRQELADLTGTTVETCIRIMSRWGKEAVVRTERQGFVVINTAALERLARQ